MGSPTAKDQAVGLEKEGDVRERLLPPEEIEIESFTHEELLHSIGSFSAVVWPVTVTMILASIVVVNLQDPDTAAAVASAYLVYNPDDDAGASDGTKLSEAIINALTIVSFFGIATFVIVFCYKFNFTKMLIGYMMFSSTMLLGMLGGHMLEVALVKCDALVDTVTMTFCMYNFAVVGVIAIFYQKGTPMWLAQVYLVLTSVIMAWQLGQFPEWTTWALVVVLAFYDLCAVLTPCGPLKWLVQLVQKEGRPLPGLLYEAEIRIEPPVPVGDQNVPTSPLPISQTKYYQAEASSCNTTKAKPSTGTARRNSNNTHTSEQRHHLLKQRLIRFYQEYNPNAIKRVDKILDRYEGKEEKLWEDLYHKYIAQEEEPGNTIKLGLGDFVFYSVLVSRAAQYELSSMIACLTAILMGLGGTLFLLGIYKKALPALPISILLGVVTYFWVRGCFVSFANSRLDSSVVF